MGRRYLPFVHPYKDTTTSVNGSKGKEMDEQGPTEVGWTGQGLYSLTDVRKDPMYGWGRFQNKPTQCLIYRPLWYFSSKYSRSESSGLSLG